MLVRRVARPRPGGDTACSNSSGRRGTMPSPLRSCGRPKMASLALCLWAHVAMAGKAAVFTFTLHRPFSQTHHRHGAGSSAGGPQVTPQGSQRLSQTLATFCHYSSAPTLNKCCFVCNSLVVHPDSGE